jgi:hypothetical protein
MNGMHHVGEARRVGGDGRGAKGCVLDGLFADVLPLAPPRRVRLRCGGDVVPVSGMARVGVLLPAGAMAPDGAGEVLEVKMDDRQGHRSWPSPASSETQAVYTYSTSPVLQISPASIGEREYHPVQAIERGRKGGRGAKKRVGTCENMSAARIELRVVEKQR